jgi:ribosomal protein S25
MSLMGTGTFKTSVEDLALEELTRLSELREVQESDLANTIAEIKSIKSVLRAVTPQAPKKKKEASKAGTPFVMSAERTAEVHQWLTGNENEITSRAMRDKFPWSGSYCNMALKMLRETGVIRLSATVNGTNIYRSLI